MNELKEVMAGLVQELRTEIKEELVGEVKAIREEMKEMTASMKALSEQMKHVQYAPIEELMKKFAVGAIEGKKTETEEEQQQRATDATTPAGEVAERGKGEVAEGGERGTGEEEPSTPTNRRHQNDNTLTPEKGRREKKKEKDVEQKAANIEKGKVRLTEEMHEETFVTGSTLNMGERRNGSVERHDEGGLDEMMEVFQKHRLTREELGAAMHTKSKQMQGKYMIYGPESWGYTKTMKAFLREHGEELEEHLDKRMRREGEELQGHVEGGDAETP